MAVNYYFSVFPVEALIASELDPLQFGAYMATGSKKGSSEIIMFIELKGEFDSSFDWEYAKKQCVPHPNGDPKHSVYLSVYKTLESIPLDQLGSLYLTTRDGRTLELSQSDYSSSTRGVDYFIYQELCPITPLIVSKLNPEQFAGDLTNPEHKVSVPKIVFADIRPPQLDNPEKTGNTGGLFFNQKPHFLSCVASISSKEGKANKTFSRTHVESFSYQMVGDGFFVGDGSRLLFYKMPTIDEIKSLDYDWGRSALIL